METILRRHHFKLGVPLVAICSMVGPWSAAAEPVIRSFQNPAPVVSFDLYVAGPDGTVTLPPSTPVGEPGRDEDGVAIRRIGAGIGRHIADIAGQASGMSNRDLDMQAALGRNPSLSTDQLAALGWLAHNTVSLEQQAVVWHYTTPRTFNNLYVRENWPSAFAQADVIKALLLAYARSKEEQYLRLAQRAAYAFAVPCERGGLRCEVGGVKWFGEIPLPYGYAPMILNGHLYALVMLDRLQRVIEDARIQGIFQEGLESAKRILLNYDTGYWTIYQLRPRVRDIYIVLDSDSQEVVIREIVLTSSISHPSFLRFGHRRSATYAGNLEFGQGWGASSKTGRALRGIGEVQLQPGHMTVENDPITYDGFDVTVSYSAPQCSRLRLATLDYRAGSDGFVVLPASRSRDDDSCILKTRLRHAVNQWSQLDLFYHMWHTELVTELWRVTGDPTLYATAVRWLQYADADRALDETPATRSVREPIFDVQVSSEDDAAIAQVLGGVDPARLSTSSVREVMELWLGRANLPAARRATLRARAGITRSSHPAQGVQ